MNKLSIQLFYVYDPLCRWCFGFHPVIEKLEKRLEGRLAVTALPGGLAMDDDAGSISEGYPGLREEVKRVEEVTKKKFGEPFKLLIEGGSHVLDSLPPALAQMIVNETDPGRSAEVGSKLQVKPCEEGENSK